MVMRGVFGVAPGMNFPRALMQGLIARAGQDDPAALARMTVYLNTRRMQRAVEAEMTREGARLLPRFRLVTDLTQDILMPDVPHPVSPLRRRLELTPLIEALLKREKTIAAESAVFELADSLATLMDEMQGEGVLPEAIARIDVANHSAHWQRTRDFIEIITQYFQADVTPDQQAFQRRLTLGLIDRWQVAPPEHPVIVAGSTGSRGTTRLLMWAVAALPQGVLVLPGFDFDTTPAVWAAMSDVRVGEDHPQYRYCRLLADLEQDTVAPWVSEAAPVPARNTLISLSLRPAPVTDQWMVEGRNLQDLDQATAGMTLIAAPSPRAEAVAIALVLRSAAHEGKRAALISPDRNLTRMVTAMLDQWGLNPDDSAGEPLALAPTGRFLRMVAAMRGTRITGEALLAVLKHPAMARGCDRGAHLRHTLKLEMHIREKGVAFTDALFLQTWARGFAGNEVSHWATWLAGLVQRLEQVQSLGLSQHVADHLAVVEALATGPDGTAPGNLWTTPDGEQTHVAMAGLIADADAAGEMAPGQFADILRAVLQQGEVRKQQQFHPGIMIWGTREARIQGADLVILGGLNDGIWPAVPAADPWLNRDMRLQAGLLLPERRIGLAAHDYQQAVCAPEVVLTRARRDAQAETVASRWLNRLTNLLAGLRENGGPEALAAMQARGDVWLAMAAAIDVPDQPVAPAPRPAPRPPVEHRPKQLSVTAVQRLMRDPYEIYASRVLGLNPLFPLRPQPDARLRGKVIHGILEYYVRNRPTGAEPRAHLMAAADAMLNEEVAWPTIQALWRARLERAADFFLEQDQRHGGKTVLLEERAGLTVDATGFRLTAQPDRIDVLPDGRLQIIDYKTGSAPTANQQKLFDVQLLLEACMAERGAFGDNLPSEVASVAFLVLGSKPELLETEITADLLAEVWANFQRLLGHYANPAQGYAARRALVKEDDHGTYDHLARFGEWKMTDRAVPIDVGGAT
jgi:ATP-dependent helicase/nuclease subunit B